MTTCVASLLLNYAENIRRGLRAGVLRSRTEPEGPHNTTAVLSATAVYHTWKKSARETRFQHRFVVPPHKSKHPYAKRDGVTPEGSVAEEASFKEDHARRRNDLVLRGQDDNDPRKQLLQFHINQMQRGLASIDGRVSHGT
jgi:hypothetical protein